MNHRYTLQPYAGPESRFMCPKCRHRRDTFKRYIDTERDEYLDDHVGRCDRAESCGYHYTPKQYFKANPGAYQQPAKKMFAPPPRDNSRFDTIPDVIFNGTQRGYDKNIFAWFLFEMFGPTPAIDLIEKYKIGTAKHWPGATIFWQIDAHNRIRTGKIMLYDKETCRRVKSPYNCIAWVHGLLRKSESRKSPESPKVAATEVGKTESRESPKVAAPGCDQNPANHLPDFRSSGLSDFKLKQCFFGEHLLPLEPLKIVAIAESEKTAVIASFYYPSYIWLAAGSLEGLTTEKCQVLQGRRVILFPDVNGYAKWHSKASALNARMHTTTFSIDTTLQRLATPTQRQRGIDIADLWLDALLLEWEVDREMGWR